MVAGRRLNLGLGLVEGLSGRGSLARPALDTNRCRHASSAASRASGEREDAAAMADQPRGLARPAVKSGSLNVLLLHRFQDAQKCGKLQGQRILFRLLRAGTVWAGAPSNRVVWKRHSDAHEAWSRGSLRSPARMGRPRRSGPGRLGSATGPAIGAVSSRASGLFRAPAREGKGRPTAPRASANASPGLKHDA